MAPESTLGLMLLVLPECPPVSRLDLGPGTFLIPSKLEGPRFKTKSKEVGRISIERAPGTED